MKKRIFVILFVYILTISIVKTVDSGNRTEDDSLPELQREADVKAVDPSLNLAMSPLRALADGGALINEHTSSELLVRVNANGKVVGTVYDAGSNKLTGVYELDGDLIVVMKETTKRLKFTSTFYPEIVPHSYSAGTAEVIPFLGESFIHTDFDANNVRLYNMTSRSSKVLTTDVDDPTGIAWYYNESDGTSRFYVGQLHNQSVKIFDESWAVVGTIPKKFDESWTYIDEIRAQLVQLFQVSGIIISPVNTLFVADRFKNEIDEFDLDGNFLRNVLSGLDSVWSMSYHPAHPSFIWVAFFDYAARGINIKRIKIY